MKVSEILRKFADIIDAHSDDGTEPQYSSPDEHVTMIPPQQQEFEIKKHMAEPQVSAARISISRQSF